MQVIRPYCCIKVILNLRKCKPFSLRKVKYMLSFKYNGHLRSTFFFKKKKKKAKKCLGFDTISSKKCTFPAFFKHYSISMNISFGLILSASANSKRLNNVTFFPFSARMIEFLCRLTVWLRSFWVKPSLNLSSRRYMLMISSLFWCCSGIVLLDIWMNLS